jgi:hypothetical protein
MQILLVVTVLCTVAMVGTEFTIAMILNPALDRLEESIWLPTMQLLAKTMGRVMPIWYALGFVLIGTQTYLRFNTPSRWWLLTSVVLWAAAIIYSITMLVPINNRIASAGAGSLPSVMLEHHHWDMLHRWRVALLLVAGVCLLIGLAG